LHGSHRRWQPTGNAGIQLIEGFRPTASPGTRVVAVVTRGNPLMEAILITAIVYLRAAVAGGTCLKGKWVLAVSGPENNTSSIPGPAAGSGWQNQVFIGGVPENLRVCLTDSPCFVIEDEYDLRIFNKRSKFVLSTRTAVLNNLEF
jgi:UDP-N-acetylmuramate-alanine ligase